MSEWDRYRPESLNDVFTRLGAFTRRPPETPDAWVWIRRIGETVKLASYTPEPSVDGVRADHVKALARNLGLDPATVFRMLAESGGRILDI